VGAIVLHLVVLLDALPVRVVTVKALIAFLTWVFDPLYIPNREIASLVCLFVHVVVSSVICMILCRFDSKVIKAKFEDNFEQRSSNLFLFVVTSKPI